MNKTALKNFATWSRRKLIEQVQTKALLYGIDEKNGLHIEEQFGQLLISGQTYPLSIKPAFSALQKQLEQKGYKQLLEEVAYTWFNRIIAIRYMEVHEYLPEKVNVLSSSSGRVDPDILFEYDTMDLEIKQEEVRELVNAGNTEAAFRVLFVAQCNALNRILPFMFEPIQDYTELLLPDFLLGAESVIKTLVQNEGLTESFAEIEVIGWLYQYYIAEEKDRVFAQKSKYKKEEIPFATQLFTPRWIVQYMVQNSLGRYWTEAHREDGDLIDNWEYFIKHEEEDFLEKIAPYVNKELKVEDIKLLDPAMGSGHILVYAFEVFHEIYEKCGYPERDIPRLILENNLYGLDIDDRAYQLAAFAVVMKAASYSKRFLRSLEREGIQLNLTSIQETNYISDDVISYIAQQEVGEQYNQVKAFFNQYHNAKTYGSLINITEREIEFIEERFNQIENNPVEDLFFGEQHEIAKQVLLALIHQTKIMRNEYDIVVMNPPYMGNKSMDKTLANYLLRKYPNSKYDLYASFIEKSIIWCKKDSYIAMISQHSWMFLNSYDRLRHMLLNETFISNMLHLGTKAFEEISGEVVQTTSFVLKKSKLDSNGTYVRMVDFDKPELKKDNFNNKNIYYFIKQKDFLLLPDYVIAYWIDDITKSIFTHHLKLNTVAEAKAGLQTGNNDIFLRLWHEVEFNKIGFNMKNHEAAEESMFKWFPYNKGGGYKKWYGNQEFVVNWEKRGLAIHEYNNIPLDYKGAPVRNKQYYFRKGITWSTIGSGNIGARYCEGGFLFDTKGSMMFTDESNLKFLLAVILNKTTSHFLSFLSATMDYSVGQVLKIPFMNASLEQKNIISNYVENCIKLSKVNWDSYENSWDFKGNPLIGEGNNLSGNYLVFKKNQELERENIRIFEEKINEIFINYYGLKGILDEKVNLDEITYVTKTLKEDIIDFLSYFVGCLMGRFPFDKILSRKDILITERTYFKNDIIQSLREFLAISFSANTVDENIQWLAEGLEMKNDEDAEARLRRYFLDEFFKNHCKMYQNKPIYWLVDSGKQKGLRTLIYMHRYQPDTMATIRFEHLQEIQAKYQQEIADLENRLVNPNLSATDKKKLNAEKVSFEKKIDELREFDKRLAAIAAEEIEIDLDDGVKVNYEKFYRGGEGVLAKIK